MVWEIERVLLFACGWGVLFVEFVVFAYGSGFGSR